MTTVIPSEVEESRREFEDIHMRAANYFVYILTNQRHTVLYIGVSNDLERRIAEHAKGSLDHFTRRFNANKLIYAEAFPDRASAIAREKQLKQWRRSKKEALVARLNPGWVDLRRHNQS